MSKWKERIPGIVISVLLVAVFAVFMVILLQSKMVPTKLLILGGIALVLLVASAVLLVRSIRNKGQFICGAWRWCLVLRATTFRLRPAR